MATYYSGLYNTSFPTSVGHKSDSRQLFRWGRRNRVYRELLDELIGATAGATALVAVKRVAHSTTELGGLRTIETRDMINRATAAADRTQLRDFFSEDSKIATPANGAGDNWTA
jgi:hypothetical protein